MRRMTQARRMVLTVMLSDPEAEWHGYGLAERTGLATGTVSPMLSELATGPSPQILQTREEMREEALAQGRSPGRPRRLYRLNPDMVQTVRQMVGDAQPLSVGAEYRRARAIGNGEMTPEQADAQRFEHGAQMLREQALAAVPLLFAHLTAAERQELAQRLAVSTEAEVPAPTMFAVLRWDRYPTWPSSVVGSIVDSAEEAVDTAKTSERNSRARPGHAARFTVHQLSWPAAFDSGPVTQ